MFNLINLFKYNQCCKQFGKKKFDPDSPRHLLNLFSGEKVDGVMAVWAAYGQYFRLAKIFLLLRAAKKNTLKFGHF